jgi:hypothetical protein
MARFGLLIGALPRPLGRPPQTRHRPHTAPYAPTSGRHGTAAPAIFELLGTCLWVLLGDAVCAQHGRSGFLALRYGGFLDLPDQLRHSPAVELIGEVLPAVADREDLLPRDHGRAV